MKINKNINSVSTISIKDFTEKYLKPQKPLLIKGLANHYPAGKKWTIDYLKDVCGDVKVELFDNNNKDTSSTAFTAPDLKMKFSKYVDLISKDEPSNLRMFLFNMFKCKPKLRKDFPCPYMFKGILGKMGYMFFGSKNTKVRIHQDIDMSNVMLTQFHGRKRVVLISPEYSDLLYRLPFNTHSLVDLDNPDYNKYPGLAYVEAEEYILEPGDALFMPSGYWHYITYLDGGFAVSYRKIAQSFKMKLLGALSLTVYMPLDKLMNFLFGKKWLAKKEQIAELRAHKAMIKKMIESGYLHIKEKREEKPFFSSQLKPGHR
ncbi:MAG: cupin-like domain-containing protein [Bacteroidota bacterium]|nr:cupin-like domain-containing protein [Bacteroidota bacterium]